MCLNDLPDEVTDDLRFAIFDNTDVENPDYFFVPLMFLESFTCPAVVLKIGEHKITMPYDWCTIVGDPAGPDLEIMQFGSLNGRGFQTFAFNPLTSFRPNFYDIDIIDVYSDVNWFFPKLKPGQLLCTPLTTGHNPECVYFVKEVNKQTEIVKYANCW